MSAFSEFCFCVQELADSFSPALPVSYPALSFTPPSAQAWLEVSWFVNKPVNYGVSNEVCQLERGLAQVTVVIPNGVGYMQAEQIAEAVIENFQKGTQLSGVSVYRQPWIMSSIADPNWIRVPVSIAWEGTALS